MNRNLYFLLIIFCISITYLFFYLKESEELLALRDLLEKGDYQQLHQILDDYQTQFENGEGGEIEYDNAIRILGNPDPKNKTYFDKWIVVMPDVYTAYLARAYYYHELAWAKRGEGFARDTTDEQFTGMHEAQAYALRDIDKALELNPKLMIAYSTLISIYSTGGSRKQKFDTLKKALNINPASYIVRRDMLQFLLPKWGGSYQAIEEFLQDTEKHIDQNQELAPLMGYLDYAKSMQAYSKKDFDKTIDYATAAIEKGKKSWYFKKRAQAYYSLKDFELAVVDYSNAIKANKYDANLYVWRARAYKRLGQPGKAFRDFEFAVKLYPYNYSVRKYYARMLALDKRYDEAIESNKIALHYHPHDEDILLRMVKIHIESKQYEKAIQPLDKLIKINPEEPKYWYQYIITLNALHDCKVMNVIETYVGLCDAQGDCFNAGLKWVNETYNFLKGSHCKI